MHLYPTATYIELCTGLSTLFLTFSELFNKLSLIIHEKMHIFVPEN